MFFLFKNEKKLVWGKGIVRIFYLVGNFIIIICNRMQVTVLDIIHFKIILNFIKFKLEL